VAARLVPHLWRKRRISYRNNKEERTIEVDPDKATIAKRMFELYASGQHSLSSLRRALQSEFGVRMAKGYLEKLLKNPFYTGQFRWEDKIYQGTHMPLVSPQLFQEVQAMFRGRNKPKYRKHEFAFRGLLTCAYDNSKVTAEMKKGRYTYYRCTGFRGKCDLPYFREEELGDRLGQTLRDIQIPDAILAQLERSLVSDKGREEATRKQQKERSEQRLANRAPPARSSVPGQTGRQDHQRFLGTEIAGVAVRRAARNCRNPGN
jgi:site-specific DNA recombinase